MKSSYKALKINSLCYRDRFVKQFPLFLNELKDLNLYEDFITGASVKDSIVNKNFYELSLKNKEFYEKNYDDNIFYIQKYLAESQELTHTNTSWTNLLQLKYSTSSVNVNNKQQFNLDVKLWNNKLFSLHKKPKKENIIQKIKIHQKLTKEEKKPVIQEKVTNYKASDFIIKDKFFEAESENFFREMGLREYKEIKYDSTQDYIFHETDAKIFSKKEKKERKKQRAQRKQEKLEQEKKKQEELAKKPKNPSFYDLLNIPLELRIAKYDIPLPSEEDEEEEVIEYTPIDWEAEDLKYLIIVPHLRDIKFFDGSVGFSFGMYTGNKLLPVAVTEERVGSFLGSFIFTKRLTREIHAKKNKKALKRGGKK